MSARSLLVVLSVVAAAMPLPNPEYAEQTIATKPSQVMMALFGVFFSLACYIGVLALFSIDTPGIYLERAPPINKEF